ncbi:hypothetical protein GCM10009745_71180 [Kribbella yunnanensis]|uniref:Uncharacterized protein n=1 Tax=Kribbella yunnanensis TaxID=190194 RepID=A0ABN2IVM6_9ACTN
MDLVYQAAFLESFRSPDCQGREFSIESGEHLTDPLSIDVVYLTVNDDQAAFRLTLPEEIKWW